MAKRVKQGKTASDDCPHITIECVAPELEGGRYAVKRVVGDLCQVGADIFKDGHDLLRAVVRFRGPSDDEWREAPLTFDFNADRWAGSFPLDQVGRWVFTVDAWTDRFGSWRSALEKKLQAGQDVGPELLEGAELIEQTAKRTKFGAARTWLKNVAVVLCDTNTLLAERSAAALAPGLLSLMEAHYVPDDLTTYRHELPVWVDRERARFASWYEFFPRSASPVPGRHGTFADAERQLPRIARLGFDVVYLPPIHPIGVTQRKGKNNTLDPGPDDVGSPWAIGNEHGGHDAVDPNLGTIEDFDRFVQRANELGLEVALDYALQCSPDHPWLKAHPEWFFVRPDGSIKYAENPPKKYQDIYPLNFWCEERDALWTACRDVLLHWIDHGVRTFRVDNPHTKPFAFWEWVIKEVRKERPETVFLSEAFTRPRKLKGLAKLGFSQSYTYFTWKNTSYELTQFVEEMLSPEALEYTRYNFFANTPDILHEYLQEGGRAAFRIRLLLAATMSPLYGLYSGYELCENVPVRKGSEEYLDSEKYQLRWRDYDAPGNLNDDIATLNRIRRENRALQLLTNLRVLRSEDEHLFAYARATPDLGNRLLVAVNVDPHRPHDGMVRVPTEELGLGPDETYVVHDLLTGARYTWRGARNYVRLDPREQPGHLFRIEQP